MCESLKCSDSEKEDAAFWAASQSSNLGALSLDDWPNAGMSRKDISSTVTMARKSRKLFNYLNIKRSSLDHKARLPIISTRFFFGSVPT